MNNDGECHRVQQYEFRSFGGTKEKQEDAAEIWNLRGFPTGLCISCSSSMKSTWRGVSWDPGSLAKYARLARLSIRSANRIVSSAKCRDTYLASRSLSALAIAFFMRIHRPCAPLQFLNQCCQSLRKSTVFPWPVPCSEQFMLFQAPCSS
jgi:hypothetical protein